MSLDTLRATGVIRSATAPAPAGAGFPFGLDEAGLHEVVEASYGDWAAITGFLLAVSRQSSRGVWVWVRQATVARDTGKVLEQSLTGDRSHLHLTVHARTTREALWATEEAVVSGAASLVIAEVEAADFTSTRRLALASTRHGVPVVLLMPHSCEGATAAATRWRVSPRPSAPNRLDPRAPGHPRWRAVLERCRLSAADTGQTYDLEWNDETLSLSVAAGLVAGSASPYPAAIRQDLRRQAG